MKNAAFLFCLLFARHAMLQAQTQAELDKIATSFAAASFSEFHALLSLPNDAHYAADIEKNVAFCEAAFAKRGFTTQRLSTPAAPLLLAQRTCTKKKNAKMVLIYLQIDGQPVDSAKWNQASPWTPTLKERDANGQWNAIPYERLTSGPINPEWRIFARATSDAKGPAAAFLTSLDALASLKKQPDFNVKVIMDFEEELGSPNLPDAVKRYKTELAADRLIIFDGPRHISNQPTLSYGARGIADVTLTVFGPRQPVHSGNYGNYTPNPAMRLAQLLASMKDDAGRVTIPGFYDGITISDALKAEMARIPDNETEIRKFLGVAGPDSVANSFQESLQYPTLNIRGLDALYVGAQARTLIPDKAVAEIDIRLVPSSDPARLLELVKNHIQSRGYVVIDRDPTEVERLTIPRIARFNASVSYGAFSTPIQSETGLWLQRAMKRAFGKEPLNIPIMGGSIPISPFVITLGIPAVSVPTVNPETNQHAENENIRVGNYMDAVKTFLAVLTEKMEVEGN